MELGKRSSMRLILATLGLLVVLYIAFLNGNNTRTPTPTPTPTVLRKSDGGIGRRSRSEQLRSKCNRDHSGYMPHHPLDPLTVKELNRVKEIIFTGAGGVNSTSALYVVIHSVVLEEPPKDFVLRWRSGDSVASGRKASVVARGRGGEFYVLSVDLNSGRVDDSSSSDNKVPSSGYPTMTIEDMTWSPVAPFSSVEFNRSIVSRGIDLADVACLPLSAGWYGQIEEENKTRLIKVQCYLMKDTSNFYMRPIEGLTVLVDLDAKRVLQVSDGGRHIPVASASHTEYIYKAQTFHDSMGLNPISIEQPMGPSFKVENNHLVKWANWEFHLKPDPRAGVIVSRATYLDVDLEEEEEETKEKKRNRRRSVLYKGMTSELFVPYMDPTEGWYFKTYMDAGEYGFGLQAMPLDPLNDCPRNAYYMDAVFAAGDGTPFVRPAMACVFERYAGDIAWRHSESPITGMDVRESRPKVSLVVRMAASVANYDYIIDWEFQADGVIRVKVGLSGILMVKGTSYTNMDQVGVGVGVGGLFEDQLYGTLLSENIIGTIHDHFITFYLDMDVDGSDNSFVKVRLRRQYNNNNNDDSQTSSPTPRKSYLKATRHVAQTEKDAQVKLNLYQPTEFHLINPNKKTRVGNPVGYKLVPAATAASLLDPQDPPQKRAGFTDNQIWITPYNNRSEEEWAGGLFVYQSQGEDTLASWAARDRPIQNKDIVLWYTLGFHHIPCQEDFPIMPTVSATFELKPVNFFERNPILYMDPNRQEDLPLCNPAAS